MTTVLVIGDCLADEDWTGHATRLCPDSAGPVVDVERVVRRPGGAGFAALAAARAGADVVLVTALGADEAGRRLLTALEDAGVDVVDVGLHGPTPEKIRVRAAGGTVLRLDRHGAPVAATGAWPAGGRVRIDRADAVLVSDYGRTMASVPGFAEARRAALDVPLVWDPHPRGSRPLDGAVVVTPSVGDLPADLAAPLGHAPSPAALRGAAEAAATRWRAPVLLTCGPLGALLHDGVTTLVPTDPVTGDANGAGDVLAATVTVALAAGRPLVDAVRAGVTAASRHVAGLRAERLDRDAGADVDVDAEVRAVRARGGRVVATSGCFDVLHAGHLALLRHARSLGDALCVCVNSDRSVRALKGSSRPINPEAERAALLRALDCVDQVVVFDEATPCDVLRRLRPDVFVKGGDYDARTLPEHAVMAEWGGTVAIGPYVENRSTSGLLAAVRRLAG